MVGRIAEKWHFCYTIHTTLHLSLFWSDGGNDDGVLLPMVLLLLFASPSDSSVSQSDKQKQVSLCDDPCSFLGPRNKYTCPLYQLPRKQKKYREREYNPLVHSSHFPQLHIFTSRKAKQQQPGNTPKFFVLKHQKNPRYSTASGAKPAGPGIHKHTRHTTPLIT